MSLIAGGFQVELHTSATETGATTFRGFVQRINPAMNPNNINVRGGGRRGLYDVLLGMREPTITLDLILTDETFLSTYQNGETPVSWVHVRYNLDTPFGLSYQTVRMNTVSVECRAGEAVRATIELWAVLVQDLALANFASPSGTAIRWSDTDFFLDEDGQGFVEELTWQSWRYEVNNNLQRLPNVNSGATRDMVPRQRGVTGMLVKDLADFDEYLSIVDEDAKIDFKLEINGVGTPTIMFSNEGRWGRLEGPGGIEDLVYKRYPFTLLDLTT